MNIADILIFTFLLFFFIRGLLRGFVRTIISPIALIAGTFLAYLYYQHTQDFLKALMLSILAPFVISLALGWLLHLYEHTGKRKGAIGSVNRIGGGLLGVTWSGLWLVLVLIFVTLIPIQLPGLKPVQETIMTSNFYGHINAWLGSIIPTNSLRVDKIAEILDDPEQFEVLKETPEYGELINDDTLRTILNDKDTMEQIQKQDVAELMKNPKFQALLQDEDLIRKVFALHQKLLKIETEPPVTLADSVEAQTPQ